MPRFCVESPFGFEEYMSLEVAKQNLDIVCDRMVKNNFDGGVVFLSYKVRSNSKSRTPIIRMHLLDNVLGTTYDHSDKYK